MSLSFKVEKEHLSNGSTVAIAYVSGFIDIRTVRVFEDETIKLLSEGNKYLILNFSDVGYMNSTGLGILVKVQDKYKDNDGSLTLVGVPDKISDLFKMLGMDTILDVKRTNEEAIDSLPFPLLPQIPDIPDMSLEESGEGFVAPPMNLPGNNMFLDTQNKDSTNLSEPSNIIENVTPIEYPSLSAPMKNLDFGGFDLSDEVQQDVLGEDTSIDNSNSIVLSGHEISSGIEISADENEISNNEEIIQSDDIDDWDQNIIDTPTTIKSPTKLGASAPPPPPPMPVSVPFHEVNEEIKNIPIEYDDDDDDDDDDDMLISELDMTAEDDMEIDDLTEDFNQFSTNNKKRVLNEVTLDKANIVENKKSSFDNIDVVEEAESIYVDDSNNNKAFSSRNDTFQNNDNVDEIIEKTIGKEATKEVINEDQEIVSNRIDEKLNIADEVIHERKEESIVFDKFDVEKLEDTKSVGLKNQITDGIAENSLVPSSEIKKSSKGKTFDTHLPAEPLSENVTAQIPEIASEQEKEEIEDIVSIINEAEKAEENPPIIAISGTTEKMEQMENSKKEVIEEFYKRKIGIRFYEKMNPLKSYPLLVAFSKETLQRAVIKDVAQKHSDSPVQVKKSKPEVTVVPYLKGCTVYPPSMLIDISPEMTSAEFWVTPIIEGDITGTLEILYENKIVEKITITSKSIKQTWAKVSAIGAVMVPIVSFLLDGLNWNPSETAWNLIPKLIKGIENSIGLSNFGALMGVISIVTGLILYNMNKPKEAEELEKFFSTN